MPFQQLATVQLAAPCDSIAMRVLYTMLLDGVLSVGRCTCSHGCNMPMSDQHHFVEIMDSHGSKQLESLIVLFCVASTSLK